MHPAIATAAALAFSFAFAIVPTARVSAGEIAGVRMPDQAEIVGEPLVLNGLALHKKFFIKVYVIGLYLPAKQRTGAAILGSDTPRHVVMHLLHNMTKRHICNDWFDGLEANSPNASTALKQEFDTLCEFMTDVAAGEELSFTYLPGAGTIVSVKGQEKGTIDGKEFADALLSTWIGEHPVTPDAKNDLLGG